MKKSVIAVTALMASSLCFTAQAAKYKEMTVSDGGTVTGKVLFTGKDPKPKTYAITKDNSVCGDGNREIDFVKVNNGGLTNAVVYLDKVKKGKSFPKMDGKMDQKGCEFMPFLSVMHNGGSIEAINQDPVLHNIHTYEQIGKAKKTAFNVSQPEPGTISKSVKFKRGVGMKVECDAHDFMHGFVFVAKNPYYAVVDDEGNFKIDGIPPGKYKINAWHGTLGIKKGKVEVAANGEVTVEFTYKK
ncbi:MAG: carboxypeptidase regulatory-like domain-containing protein [Motiliproteus sp.]|nr:carboxypeptidase regulatory-like domain-containing protein [Motiliproteus sp.]MCW9051862.1 carboxypeptidase regulatory-like domain-containing protein [Motiliproteus sp.]